MSAPQRSRAVDVAVVGGGVIGLSAAWRLAQAGLSVAVYDCGELGGGSSRVAAGMLGPTVEAEYGPAGRSGLELGLQALAGWPEFAAELAQAAGADVGLRTTGTLVLARDRDEAEALEREIAFRQSLGLPAHRLLGSEARALEPALAPVVRLALHAPSDHSVDPRLVVAGLARASVAAGATLHPGCGVAELLCSERRSEDVRLEGVRVEGVRLDGGERVVAGHVVLAAGAWSGTGPWLGAGEHAGAAAQVAVSPPVRPVKGQTLRLRDPDGPGLISRVVRFDGGYLVPRPDGRYVLGGTVEERGFDTTPTAGAVYELLRAAREVVPGVTELELEEVAVGLRPGSPDNLPIVGRTALDGLVLATGHYRNGLLLAPITAAIGAAPSAGGELPAVADACSPQRFAARAADERSSAQEALA